MILGVLHNGRRKNVDVLDSKCRKRWCFWVTDRLGVSGSTPGVYRCGRREQSGCPVSKDDSTKQQGTKDG